MSGSLASDYKLRRGDILRIGRIQLKIKDYRVESSVLAEDRDSSPSEDNIIDLHIKEDQAVQSQDVCRICFCGETAADNPLLSVCNCSGTMKFIHYLCLKTWLHSSAVEKVTPQVISYYWKSFHCEICTCIYPCNIVRTESSILT